jgi:hypothetical protein
VSQPPDHVKAASNHFTSFDPARPDYSHLVGRLILVPFDARESIPIAVAAKLSGKSGNTIRRWAERYGIG